MDDKVKKELEKKLDPKHVKERQGLSYIEGWHAIAEANRVFGFDGWNRETLELTENHIPTKNAKNNFVVSFRARVKVTVGEISREGVGFGNGFNADVHSAYELAIKEAETDAMKRALMTFGNPFGLALYDKTKTNVGVEIIPFDGKEYQRLLDKVREAETLDTLATLGKEREENKARMTDAQYSAIKKNAGEKYKLLSATPINTNEANQPIEGVNGHA